MALSASRVEDTSNALNQGKLKIPVKATTQIWAGGGVMINAGYAVPAATGISGALVAGVAVDDALGGAADGDVSVWVYTPESHRIIEVTISTSAIVAADLFKLCYWADDATAQLSSSTAGLIGHVVEIVSATKIKVMLGRA